MSPRELQNQIHSTFSSDEAVWQNFQSEIGVLYQAAPQHTDFNNHLVREFNRKVYKIGFPALAFAPHDAGYRFIDAEISVASPDEGFVFVYTIDDDLVRLNTSDPIQVPDSYANS